MEVSLYRQGLLWRTYSWESTIYTLSQSTVKIGIDARWAFKETKTGIEEYAYRLLEALTRIHIGGKTFLLYKDKSDQNTLGFKLPNNFKIKEMWAPTAWSQTRLTLEMLFFQPDVLFVTGHVLPFISPKKTIVTIHGLEYEYFPEYYPEKFLQYLRWSTKYAVKHAYKIIAVSNATKNDLVKLYNVHPDKIRVIHHGFTTAGRFLLANDRRLQPTNHQQEPYLLYIGRIETKKNILGILAAYEILKEKYRLPHQLILAGKPGYGYRHIKSKIKNCKFEILSLGYVTEQKKWELLSGADAFLFPSFYEGFGLPILEAQALGVPVITANVSSMPEVAGEGGVFVDPKQPEEIAETTYKVVSDKEMKIFLVQRGFENIEKFSWDKCARKTLQMLR